MLSAPVPAAPNGASMPGMGQMMPPLNQAGEMPGQPPAFDPNMFQNYMQMLQYLQQGLAQQQGAPPVNPMPPFAGVPGMPPAPYSSPPQAEPTVRVSVEGMKFQYQLTEDDIHKVFKRYGQVKKVSIEENCSTATVTFGSLHDAQSAIADLDGKLLHGLEGTLRITWVSGGDGAAAVAAAAAAAGQPPYPGMPCPPPFFFPPGAAGGMGAAWPPGAQPPPAGDGSQPALPSAAQVAPFGNKDAASKGARKYTCRFLIGIENDKDFQVARRLIGSKGANMKKIVRVTDAKLRLRGQGSGYFEGAGQRESSEPLQLCISCTSEEGYKIAVREVEDLLTRIYEDYRQYCRENSLPIPDLKINFSENQLVYLSRGGGSTPPDGDGSGPSAWPAMEAPGGKASGGKDDKRKKANAKRTVKPVTDSERGEPRPNAPSVEEIQQFIDARNEARRACNFAEADRIRQMLHSRGVALMDEPGGRGKGSEVTTWRYWRD